MGYFSIDNYKEGITMSIGVIILGAIAFSDSFESAMAGSPFPTAFMFVAFSAFCPPFNGVSTIMYPIIAIAIIFAWCNYYIILYVTYAIVGPDFQPCFDKGITLVIVSSVVVFLTHLVRVRLPALDPPGMIAQVLPATLLVLEYYSSKTPHVVVPWQLIVLFFIPIAVGTLLSFFVIPHPAGQRALELLGMFSDTTVALQNQVTEKLLLAEVDEKTGKMVVPLESSTNTNPSVADTGASGAVSSETLEAGKQSNTDMMQEGKFIGVAAALEPVVVPIRKLDVQSWRLAAGINIATMLSALEIDVYSKPHIFARKAFKAVLTRIATMEHLYITIAGFLQNGQAPMKMFQLLRNELEEARAAVEMSLHRLKQVVLEDSPYEEGLKECAPRVEAACLALKTKVMQKNDGKDSSSVESDGTIGKDDIIAARELSCLVILAAKELRRTWEVVPALIAARQPEAAAAAESYFSKKNEEEILNAATGVSNGDNNSIISGSLTPQAAPAVPAPLAPASPQTEQQPTFREVLKLTPSCSSLRLKLYNVSVRTGIHSWHLKMALHMTVVYAISAVICVVPKANIALGKHAYWIIINIFATSETTSVGIVDTCWQRIAGTAIGSIGVAAIAGFGYLANGSSYIGHNTACRVVQVAIVCIWMGVFRLLQSKLSPRYYRFCTIACFLPPLIALLDSQGANVWPNIEWRLANTCIGIALHTVVSILLFPVSAGEQIKEKTSNCLQQIADMLDEISTLPIYIPPESYLDPYSTAGGGCFGGKLKKRKAEENPSSKVVEDVEAATADGGQHQDVQKADSTKRATSFTIGTTNSTTTNATKENYAEDYAAIAAEAIIQGGTEKAGKSLLDVIKLRDMVEKEYFVTKLWYKCFNGLFNNPSRSGVSSKTGSTGWFKLRPPMQVYQLDQLIFHLKHNVIYTKIALNVREWLRSQTIFARKPEVGIAVRAFSRQVSECFKALRMAIKGLVQPEEAINTVLNLREIASDIASMCNTSDQALNPEEATLVHILLSTVRNVELLFRATARALVTRDEPGVVSICDEKLQSGVSMLALMNQHATAVAVDAVQASNAAVAAAEEKKGTVSATRDGARELNNAWMKIGTGA